MRILCVIPVRGGSKGLPRKNAAELVDGISLLEWTVHQALATYPLEDIVVSTEDAELAGIARQTGIPVIPRPAALAEDGTTTNAVVDHLLETLDPGARVFDAIAILQVTSPLREEDDIRQSIALIRSDQYDSVLGACASRIHPAKLYYLIGQTAEPVAPQHECVRRQDLPPVYRRNGAIFIVTRAHYARTGRLWGGRTGLVVMPEERSIDIDAIADLEAARHLAAKKGRLREGAKPKRFSDIGTITTK